MLELIAEGRSNQAIAERLEITLRGVQKHVSSIFAKLGLPADRHEHRRVLAVLALPARLTRTGSAARAGSQRTAPQDTG